MSQAFTKGTPIDTDATLSLNSDIVVPSQKAVKSYVASQVGTPVSSVTASAPILSSGGLTPNISIPAATTSVNGYLTSTDWTTFNGKENVLTFSSPLSRTTNTISIPAATSSVNGYLTSSDWTNFNTAYTNRITSLTTTGSSGAATLSSNTLNIPNYTLSGLGGVPTTRQLTINGTAFDLSADRSWTVGSVTSVSGTGTTAGLSLSGTVTGTGNITLSGTLSTPVSTINDSTTVGQALVKLTNPSATSYLRINSDNTVTALTLSQIKSDLGLSMVFLSGNVTNTTSSTSTFEDVTGLSFAVTSGKTYSWSCRLLYGATSAACFGINNPTTSVNNYMFIASLAATTQALFSGSAPNAGTNAAVSNNGICTGSGTFTATASGTFILRFRATTLNTFTIKAGSILEYKEII